MFLKSKVDSGTMTHSGDIEFLLHPLLGTTGAVANFRMQLSSQTQRERLQGGRGPGGKGYTVICKDMRTIAGVLKSGTQGLVLLLGWKKTSERRFFPPPLSLMTTHEIINDKSPKKQNDIKLTF